jgi:hypothetical protein
MTFVYVCVAVDVAQKLNGAMPNANEEEKKRTQ